MEKTLPRPEARHEPVAAPGEPAPARHDRPAGGSPAGVIIRPMTSSDATQVLAIYQAGLDGGEASFETRAPTWQVLDAKLLPAHRHVAADGTDGRVLGWAAASGVSDRCVYQGVVEHSVYVAPAARQRGVGAALLRALTGSTEAAGIWTIQAGIFPENTASLRLHERAGFRVVGIRERLGRHHGRWRDVVLLERRSPRVGVDPAGLESQRKNRAVATVNTTAYPASTASPDGCGQEPRMLSCRAWTAAPSGVKSLISRRLAGIVARGIHSPAKNISGKNSMVPITPARPAGGRQRRDQHPEAEHRGGGQHIRNEETGRLSGQRDPEAEPADGEDPGRRHQGNRQVDGQLGRDDPGPGPPGWSQGGAGSVVPGSRPRPRAAPGWRTRR